MCLVVVKSVRVRHDCEGGVDDEGEWRTEEMRRPHTQQRDETAQIERTPLVPNTALVQLADHILRDIPINREEVLTMQMAKRLVEDVCNSSPILRSMLEESHIQLACVAFWAKVTGEELCREDFARITLDDKTEEENSNPEENIDCSDPVTAPVDAPTEIVICLGACVRVCTCHGRRITSLISETNIIGEIDNTTSN